MTGVTAAVIAPSTARSRFWSSGTARFPVGLIARFLGDGRRRLFVTAWRRIAELSTILALAACTTAVPTPSPAPTAVPALNPSMTALLVDSISVAWGSEPWYRTVESVEVLGSEAWIETSEFRYAREMCDSIRLSVYDDDAKPIGITWVHVTSGGRELASCPPG